MQTLARSLGFCSGGMAVEQTLPPQYSIIRHLVIRGGSQQELENLLKDRCDAPNLSVRCSVILTVGGDGCEPRDVIPEATKAVIERDASSLSNYLIQVAELFNSQVPANSAIRSALHPALARATAGFRRGVAIVNLPSCFVRPEDAVEALLEPLQQIMKARDLWPCEQDDLGEDASAQA